MMPSRHIWMQFIPAVVVTAGIVVVSLWESPQLPHTLSAKDKILHGCMYVVLAVTWMVPVARNCVSRIVPYMYVWLGVTLFGALMEVLQRYCTLTRTFEMADIYANAIGSLVGVALVALWLLRKK